jgi:CRP-like cAMP-binding protein
MDAKSLSLEFASHSPRNVFRRLLHESDLKQFENDSLRAISALESSHSLKSCGQREYFFSTKDENALENLFFPKQIFSRISQKNRFAEANSELYVHLMLPRISVQMLFSHTHVKRAKAGTILNVQNQTGCPLIVLLSGQCQGYFSTVGVENIIPDDLEPADFERTFGKEQCTLDPGDIFGCEMFCHHNSSSMTLIAKSNVVALTIDEKILSALVQQWKRMGSFNMSICRQLLDMHSVDATKMIADVLKMHSTLGISKLFSKKRKISLKQDLCGCLLATIPASVDVVKFLVESFNSSMHIFVPLKKQDCFISRLEHVGAFVVLSGSIAALNLRSFRCSFEKNAKSIVGLSILGPSSMFEINDPIFKKQSSSDEELLMMSREQSDILLIPQDQITQMASQSWHLHSDSLAPDSSTTVARTLIALDAAGRHAKTARTCTVGDIVSLCASEALKSCLETPEHDDLINFLIHPECSEIIENIFRSKFSSLVFANQDHISALVSCVLVLIQMPVAVHQSHVRKVFQSAITESDNQAFCIIIIRGSCVSQSTVSAKCCGMHNLLAASFFSSMSNVPSDKKPKKLESQDIFFIESLSSLQSLSKDFLGLALQINDMNMWADHFMASWSFAKQKLSVPCSSMLESFYSNGNRLVSRDVFDSKDAIPNERQLHSREAEKSKKSFTSSTHSSKLKRATASRSEFFDELKSKNEKSSRLRLRRNIRAFESVEELFTKIIGDSVLLREHWRQLDVNSSEMVSFCELQNWLTRKFPEHFKSSKLILIAFEDTLKHFRIISQGFLEIHHFSFFVQTLINFFPASLVYDEMDVNGDRKILISQFADRFRKLGLDLRDIEIGSDFQALLDASGTQSTFHHFCHWFHHRNVKELLHIQHQKEPSRHLISSEINPVKLAESFVDSPSLDDVEVELCAVLHLHPQCRLIPDAIALELPFDILKVPKGSMISHGSHVPAPRHIMFVLEGVVGSCIPDSSCNPICLSVGNSINQTVSSPWHKRRTLNLYYCASSSFGDSNFFHGVGDGLEYFAVTDAVIMILRWQLVELQWQQTMLMDLESQQEASEYFLWSKPSSSRTNYEQMKLFSSLSNKQYPATIDKMTLALLCYYSQLCLTNSVTHAPNPHVGSPKCTSTQTPARSFDTSIHTHDDDATLAVMFQTSIHEITSMESDQSDFAQSVFHSDSAASQNAVAFIVIGPAYISVKGVGLSVLTNSKQAFDEGNFRRQTIVDSRRDSKRIKTWHILAGHCAIVTSDQFASVCRGRINLSKEKNVLSIIGLVDKNVLFHYPVLNVNFVSQSTAGSVAAIGEGVKFALVDMCCSNFLEHVSLCYSNHKCFSSNSISNLALTHAGTRTVNFCTGEIIWKIGQDGIFVVLEGQLRVMFSFGELHLVPDSRKSGMSVSNHLTEMLCLGKMSVFGDIDGSVSGSIDGHIFVDCADAECKLLLLPPQAVSCLSSKCQSELKKMFQTRSLILKQCISTQRDIVHSGSFQKERMHVMHAAESESNRIQFMRDPNKYSQNKAGSDAPNSMAEVSALKHFTCSKQILMKSSCFQSLHENVKECSAHMGSFYKHAGRLSKIRVDIFESEARKFEENLNDLNVLPLNSAPKLKRLLKREAKLQSSINCHTDSPMPQEPLLEANVNSIVSIKYVSDVQKRINQKISKLKSDESLMEAFQNRVSLILAGIPRQSEVEKRNKNVSSYATPEAKATRLQANAAIIKQRCEQAKKNSILLESSFKASAAQKLEEDQIRVQNNLLMAENRLRQKHLADFQIEILPIFAMVFRFHCFVKFLLNHVPRVRHKSTCVVRIQRWIRHIQFLQKTARRLKVIRTFRRAFRRFKMMYCLWKGTFALKLLIKFMREMKKARQVTFVIKSYM